MAGAHADAHAGAHANVFNSLKHETRVLCAALDSALDTFACAEKTCTWVAEAARHAEQLRVAADRMLEIQATRHVPDELRQDAARQARENLNALYDSYVVDALNDAACPARQARAHELVRRIADASADMRWQVEVPGARLMEFFVEAARREHRNAMRERVLAEIMQNKTVFGMRAMGPDVPVSAEMLRDAVLADLARRGDDACVSACDTQ
jgi:hypothetical protein